MKTYLPRSEADQVKWMNNFAAKLTIHAPALGVPAADLATLQADVAYLTYLEHDLVPLYRTKAQEVTAYKDMIKRGPLGTPPGAPPAVPSPPSSPTVVLPGAMRRIQALVQRIKKSLGYNAAIGADLGIEPPAAAPLVGDTVKPSFTATALPGYQIRLDWKKGKLDGVRVESRRTGDADWVPLGDDRFSPYNDTRPALKPGDTEPRAYRMRYFQKDDLVGSYSDTVTALASP
jgi:hypothetical protein